MIKNLIDNITNTQGTNAKLQLLESLKTNETLKRVFFECLSSRNFYLKQVPEIEVHTGTMSLSETFDYLDQLSARTLSGNAARDAIAIVLAKLSADDAEVLTKILRKKLNCGIEVKGANKVWGSAFIKDPGYMRCTLDPSRIKYPAISEMKMDGMYLNNFVVNGMYSAESRSGELYDFYGELDAEFIALNEFYANNYVSPDNVFHGEALLLDANGNVLERTTGNGIIGKFGAKKDTGTLPEAKQIVVKLWDSVPYGDFNKGSYNLKRKIRRERLIFALESIGAKRISFVDYKEVNSLEEAIAHSKKLIKLGYEGTVLKDEDGPWKSHTSPYQCKFKNRVQVELECIGFTEGKVGTKYEGTLGALICKSSCGLIQVDVGSGLKEIYDKNVKEHVRDYIWNHQSEFLGKILTVETNSIVKDKSSFVSSLFIPSFIEWRDDKNEADDYAKIEQQIKSATKN